MVELLVPGGGVDVQEVKGLPRGKGEGEVEAIWFEMWMNRFVVDQVRLDQAFVDGCEKASRGAGMGGDHFVRGRVATKEDGVFVEEAFDGR